MKKSIENTDSDREYTKEELIQRTVAFWEPRLKRKLTTEDGRRILETAVGVFRLLHEWDVKDQKRRGVFERQQQNDDGNLPPEPQ